MGKKVATRTKHTSSPDIFAGNVTAFPLFKICTPFKSEHIIFIKVNGTYTGEKKLVSNESCSREETWWQYTKMAQQISILIWIFCVPPKFRINS